MPDVYPVRFTQTATIANGGTTSGALDLLSETLLGIFVPSSFTGTALTFQVATAVDGTYVTLTNEDGSDYSVTVAASKFVAVDPQIFAGVRFAKLVSGSAEGAERTLTLATRAI